MKIPANIIDGTASIKELKAWMYSIEDIEIEEARVQGHQRDDMLFRTFNERSIADYVDNFDGSVDYKITYHIIGNTVYNHANEGELKTLSIAQVYEHGERADFIISAYLDR